MHKTGIRLALLRKFRDIGSDKITGGRTRGIDPGGGGGGASSHYT